MSSDVQQGSHSATKNGREGRGDDKHGRILNAAVKVFAKHGFHNSKISEIARQAGVADGTIYLYFKNKDDILISLFEEKMGVIVDRFRAEIAGIEDPEGKLRRFFEYHVEMLDENRDLAGVLTVELRQSHKFMKEYRPAKFAEYLKILSQIIREGKDRGLFRGDLHPGVIKRAMYGAIDELFINYMLSPKTSYDLKMATNQLCDVFIDGMRAR